MSRDATEFSALLETVVPKERPGPVGGARDRNRREKVKALLEAGLALCLARGIEATTIDDIAKGAGVAKGSFYRYFAGKPQLLEALFAPLFAGVRDAFSRCDEALRAAKDAPGMNAAYLELGEALATLVFTHAEVVQLYLQENRGPASAAREPVRALASLVIERAIAITDTAREAGLLRPFPAVVSARTVVGAVEHLLFAMLSGEDVGVPLELPEHLVSLVLDGLRGVHVGAERGLAD